MEVYYSRYTNPETGVQCFKRLVVKAVDDGFRFFFFRKLNVVTVRASSKQLYHSLNPIKQKKVRLKRC